MNCPICSDSRMKEVEKNGILIDICPSCKGVWLDRGELDKLMRDVQEVRQEYNDWYYEDKPAERDRRSQHYQSDHRHDHDDRHRHDHDDDDRHRHDHDDRHRHDHDERHRHPHHKKKKSVLDVFGDLFD